MNNEENKENEIIKSSDKRKRIRKATSKPIAAVKSPIEAKIKQLSNQGFDHNRIAAMLMCQKSLVEQVLK